MPTTTPAWAPTTARVAAYVTSRTVLYDQPGVDTPAGDFTDQTMPTGQQVTQMISDACAWVSSAVGTLDPQLNDLATAAAALYTAALVELSYPTRDADVTSTAAQLFARADELRGDLATKNNGTTGTSGGAALLPVSTFPDSPWWGDYNL